MMGKTKTLLILSMSVLLNNKNGLKRNSGDCQSPGQFHIVCDVREEGFTFHNSDLYLYS